jgi:hypothetical protein
VIGKLEQPLVNGVTVIKLLTVTFVLFTVVKAGINPLPVKVGIPVNPLVAVQLYCVLAIAEPLNKTPVVD